MDVTLLATVAVILFVALILIYLAIRIVNQFERLVVFTLGRTDANAVKGPGLVFLIPIVQRGVKVNIAETFLEAPSQTNITKDNAPTGATFLIYWRIVDPRRSVATTQNSVGQPA